jgi:hypothetical protein
MKGGWITGTKTQRKAISSHFYSTVRCLYFTITYYIFNESEKELQRFQTKNNNKEMEAFFLTKI